jgi:RimJ/RimL family protein N-acetyltransferase
VLPSDYEYVYALTTHELVGWRWRYRGATPNLETFAQALYHNTLVNFVIERRDSPQRIGFAQAFDASERNGWCHIGLTLDPALSRMGWALESGVLFVNYLFTLWNFRKLYATVVEFNAPEFQSALQRGFELEGRLVEHEYHNGRYWDMLLYSYTREAWETTGPALVAKLAEPPSIG